MKLIRNKIKRYLLKRGWRKCSAGDLKMLVISTEITSQYINSRAFRRKMDDIGIGKSIKDTIDKWHEV